MYSRLCFSSLCALCIAIAASAHAEGKFSEGKWRLELSTSTGVNLGSEDRSGDVLALSTVEYEIPLSGHVTAGLKLHPLFGYFQDEIDNNDFFDGEFGAKLKDIDFDLHGDNDGGDSVCGGGVGAGVRVYQVKTERRGLFLDLGVSALFHSGELNHDDSNIDFMSGVGLGYQFNFGLNTKVQLAHISNAGLGDSNAGSNVVGLGFGFRF